MSIAHPERIAPAHTERKKAIYIGLQTTHIHVFGLREDTGVPGLQFDWDSNQAEGTQFINLSISGVSQ